MADWSKEKLWRARFRIIVWRECGLVIAQSTLNIDNLPLITLYHG